MSVKRRVDKLEMMIKPDKDLILIRFVGLDLVAIAGEQMSEAEFAEKYPNWKPDQIIQIGEGLDYDN